MQALQNLPWYIYLMLVVMVVSFLYRAIKKGKQVLGMEANLFDAKFQKASENALTGHKLFSISLDAVQTEWWEVHTNTLAFKKVDSFDFYMQNWGIDTKEGYWDLTDYFMKDGRRWYFDFIFAMVKNEPEENWNRLMDEKFGNNERAQRYLDLLKADKALNILKGKGFITFDSEMEKGVAAYDASVLVGQARRAYTAKLISEQEAWKVIGFATRLARDNFSSWEEFGKSYILGFTLDTRPENKGYLEEVYHMYRQLVENPTSPWNTIDWPN